MSCDTQSLPYTFELKWKLPGGISTLVCDLSGSLPDKGKVMLPGSLGSSLLPVQFTPVQAGFREQDVC